MTATPDTAHSRGPRLDIQGLRALAVLAVVACHAFGWPSGGFAGVDVFFVISGFLLTDLILRDLQRHGRIRLRRFYGARIRRLLPAATLVLVVTVAVGFVLFNRPRADATLVDAAWSAVFAANVHFAAVGTDYFQASSAISPLQHFWSLSIEEQFAITWPLALTLLALAIPILRTGRAASRTIVALLALILGGASLLWALSQTATAPEAAYFSTLGRVWELAVGGVLAAAAPLASRLPALARVPLSWLGIAGVVAAFFLADAASPFPAPGALLPVAATALVLAAGVGADRRARHLFPLTNPLAVFVGDMSYSIYLWHLPTIVFAGMLLPANTIGMATTLVAVGVLSLTSYLLVERPLHRSPWLRATDELTPRETEAQAIAVEEPEPAETPVRRIHSSRPAGWQPGTRYFPGAGAPAAHPVALHVEPAAPPLAPAAAPIAPASAAAAPPPDADAERGPVRRAAWHRWRLGLRGQLALGAAVAVIGAGVVLLGAQNATGDSLLHLPDPAVAASGTQESAGDIADELAAAVTATAWPDLSPSLDAVIRNGSSDNPAHDCFDAQIEPDLTGCTWGSPNAPHHMYLVGDSTAMAYAPAFREIALASDGQWRITTVGLYGCRLTDVLVENDDAEVMAACPGRKSTVTAAIAADAPDLVVVSNAYTLGHTTDGQDLGARDLITATGRVLSVSDAPLVYLAPPPLGADLGRCYSSVSSPADCVSGVDATWTQMEHAAEAVAAESGQYAISSLPYSCWQELCPAFAGTLPTKYDQTHMTVAFAEHIGPLLRQDLVDLGLM